MAKQLGNTPSICRKCCIHPAVLESYLDGETLRAFEARTSKVLAHDLSGLEPEEAAVLAFLEARLARDTNKRVA